VLDEYLETVTDAAGGSPTATARRAAGGTRDVTLAYRLPAGGWAAARDRLLHAPRPGGARRGRRWVTVRLMQEPVRALQQSYLRTKARSYAEFARVMELRTNSSNNTVYADADGTIAYWHGNFLPVRDPGFDWTRPVDGSDPRTEWRGLHRAAEVISLKNPASGWIQNTNNWPFSAAGPASPRRDAVPALHVDERRERARDPRRARAEPRLRAHARRLIAAAYDPELPGFDPLLPPLFQAYDALPAGDSLRARLAEQVAVLRAWDRRWGAGSVATSLAVYWGEEMPRRVRATTPRGPFGEATTDRLLARAPRRAWRGWWRWRPRPRPLERDFGAWRTRGARSTGSSG
jgi:acyl-homoserine-lactone acylase